MINAIQKDPCFQVDEQIYELLKKVLKCKEITSKYKEKAQTLMDKLLNINIIVMPDQRMAR